MNSLPMHLTSLPLPLGYIFGLESPWQIAVVIPVAALVLGGTIAIFAMYFEHRRRALWHETARVALEKGQPLPPSELDHASRQPAGDDGSSNDFRGGLVLIGVGLGLYLCLAELAPAVRFVSTIPGFIGVALVLHGLLHAMFSRKKSGPDDRPPQP